MTTAILPLGEAVLFESAACGLVVTSIEGLILRANAAFCHWIGVPSEELTGQRRIQDYFSMGGRVFHQTHCAPMLQVQGSVAEVQVDVLDSERERVPMLMNIVRHAHGDTALDNYAFFIAVERRTYEVELLKARKTAESELEARLGLESRLRETNRKLSIADRHKDEFLATLSHELRNPLAPMRNVIEALKRKSSDALVQARSIDVLERQLKQLTHLVDDLMDISRISRGGVQLRREPLDLVALLMSSVDDTQKMVSSARHTLDVEWPEARLTVRADSTRLTQVFVNLITNAVKYTPKGGKITVRAERQGDEAVVKVRDTGIGIPKDSQASIFENFSQLTPALERSNGGLGIGLALVRALITLHGGEISVSSDGINTGSEFTVRLPISDAAIASTGPAPTALAASGCRILVVDDNVDSAQSMGMALDLFGYRTRLAYTGVSALQAVSDFLPEVVLLDIGLPDQNGYQVARSIRSTAASANIFLIAITGWGQESDKQHALEAGFNIHLTKPVDFEQLKGILLQRSDMHS